MARYLWAAVLAGLFVAVPATPAEGAGRKLDPQVEGSVDDLLVAGATPRVRIQAAIVLGHAGTARSVPALAGALEDPHAGVRAAAALALGNLGTPSVVDPLVDHAEDPDPFVRDHVQRALLSLRGPAVLRRLAVQASSSRPGARAIIVQALAGFEGEQADSALVAFFDERDPAVREAHRAAVAGLPPPRRDAVLHAGLTSANPRVRIGAIQQAGPIAGAAAVEPLLAIACDGAQPKPMRAEARRSLVAIRELIDPDVLAGLARASADPAVRARAVALAGIRGGEVAESVVLRGLADPAPAVRFAASRAILELPRDRAEPAVQTALQGEGDDRVRRSLQRAARALARGEPPTEEGALAVDELPDP
jgi:HEAT repeat protein